MTSNLFRIHQGVKHTIFSNFISLKPTKYREKLIADLQCREYLMKKLRPYFPANIYTKITEKKETNILHCTSIVLNFVPAEVIEGAKKDLARIIPNIIVDLKIERYYNHDLTSAIVAAKMSSQLVERGSINRKLTYVTRWALKKGAIGCRIEVKGRINGIQIARKERYQEGIIQRNCLDYDVQRDYSLLCTRSGTIGVKVWLNKNYFKKKKK